MDAMSSQATGSTSSTQHYKETLTLGRFARIYGAQLGILGVFFGLWIIFIISAPNTFLSSRIYFAFMSTIPFFAIMAIPLTMLVIAGEMDLSFPSIMGMGMVAFSFVYAATGSSIASVSTRVFLAFLAALIAGGLIGWLNGVIIVRFGIPSLVATIGTQFFWRGAVLVLTEGKNYSLGYIKETFLYPVLVGKIGGYFPMQMLWLIVIAIFGWVLLNRHKFGAHVYLIGDNVQSAQLWHQYRTRDPGIHMVKRSLHLLRVYGFHRLFLAQPGRLPSERWLLSSGGTSVPGAAPFRTFLFSSPARSRDRCSGLTGFWTQLIYGLIIVLSVIMHTYLRKRVE
jgi:simple sugar transport system permease protein